MSTAHNEAPQSMNLRLISAFAFALATCVFSPLQALGQATDMPGVTASIAFARQYGGVLHIGISLANSTDKEVVRSAAVNFSEVVALDAAAGRKLMVIQDAEGRFLAGPISDWNKGGRWFPHLAPHSQTILWALFEAVSPGDSLTISTPLISLNDITVKDDRPASQGALASSLPPYKGTPLTALRSPGQLRVTISISNPAARTFLGTPAMVFRDVYALDPYGKRIYPLLKGQDGLYLAAPMSDKNEGGRLFLSKTPAAGSLPLVLTFQAPPDQVKSVDIVLPHFPPFEAIDIVGTGGAGESGVAVAGGSEALERAIKELKAAETEQEIKVNLAADVLFDFDKDVVKPEAAPELERVATVIQSYPGADVSIEGHTDAKGNDSYNQALSERRASAVADWLASHSGFAKERLHVRGWGRSKPIEPNTKPDGSDNPEGRARNRRVEIVVHKGTPEGPPFPYGLQRSEEEVR